MINIITRDIINKCFHVFRHKSHNKKDYKKDGKERHKSSKNEKSKRKTEEKEFISSEEEYTFPESEKPDEMDDIGSALAKARAMLSKSFVQEKEELDPSSRSKDDSKQTTKMSPTQTKDKMQALEPASSSETGLTMSFIKQSPHQMIDTKFLHHLAEMHPVSALHELTHRLGWPGPNITLAFDCGPPFAKMYIFKAQVNGQMFQNTVAVNDVKLAKQNVAWLALQEMGFVKPDPANPV